MLPTPDQNNNPVVLAAQVAYLTGQLAATTARLDKLTARVDESAMHAARSRGEAEVVAWAVRTTWAVAAIVGIVSFAGGVYAARWIGGMEGTVQGHEDRLKYLESKPN